MDALCIAIVLEEPIRSEVGRGLTTRLPSMATGPRSLLVLVVVDDGAGLAVRALFAELIRSTVAFLSSVALSGFLP